jgi:excinuclease ABC subunit C
LFLSGEKKRLIKKLEKENSDQVKALKHIQDVALISQENNLVGVGRIEGYDISHLSGKESFGAMTVFENGQPDKSEYRLFSIKKAPAGDDLRALKEVLERRFRHNEWQMPDLILIDGGKPQIDFTNEVLKSLQVNIPVVGISKYQGEDKLVFPKATKKNTKDLSESMKPVLTKIRDEAHRFSGMASRRKRRSKNK